MRLRLYITSAREGLARFDQAGVSERRVGLLVVGRQMIWFFQIPRNMFQVNMRGSCSNTEHFYRLMQHAVASDPAPYRAIIGGKSRSGHTI